MNILIKEILAAVLLLTLIAGALLNTWYLDKTVNDITELVTKSQEYSDTGDLENAVKELRGAIEIWEEKDPYARILLRQTETDSISDTFYGLLGELVAGEFDRAHGTYERLYSHLRTIANMERLSWSSIF